MRLGRKKREKVKSDLTFKQRLSKIFSKAVEYMTDFRKYVPGHAGPALTFFIIILTVPALSIIAMVASLFHLDLAVMKELLSSVISGEYLSMFLSVLNSPPITFGSIIILGMSIYQVSRGVGNIYQISKDMFPSDELRKEETILGYYIYTIRITLILILALVTAILMLALGPIAEAFNVFYGFIVLRSVVLFFLLSGFFALLYILIPNVKIRGLDAFVGGLVTTTGMVVLYLILSIYLAHANFSNVYGPLASIVMVFFVLKWGCEVFYLGMYICHRRYMKHQEMKVQVVQIERMTHYGEGVATVFGKRCYLRNVFTGEEVEIVVDKETRRRAHAFVSQVITPSIVRDDPICAQADSCELCQLQYMNYLHQITHKHYEIMRALKRFTKFPYDEEHIYPIMPANDVMGYRQFVSFPVYEYEGGIYIGYLSDSLCTFMAQCEMSDIMIRHALFKIEGLLNETQAKAYDKKTKKGIRQIVAKKIEDNLIIILITGTDDVSEELIEGIRNVEEVTSLFVSHNTGRNPENYSKNIHKVFGLDYYPFHYQGNEYILSASSYNFLSPEMEDNTIQLLKDMIDPSDRILSLYCKAGILELELPNRITAVDTERSNIEDAKENARRLGIDNKTFICNTIEAEVSTQVQRHDFDSVIIQLGTKPFYGGIARAIHIAGIKHIYVVSDDPHVFAKSFNNSIDAVANVQRDYELVSVMGVDKEPFTARIQAIYELERKS